MLDYSSLCASYLEIVPSCLQMFPAIIDSALTTWSPNTSQNYKLDSFYGPEVFEGHVLTKRTCQNTNLLYQTPPMLIFPSFQQSLG